MVRRYQALRRLSFSTFPFGVHEWECDKINEEGVRVESELRPPGYRIGTWNWNGRAEICSFGKAQLSFSALQSAAEGPELDPAG